MKKRVLIIFPLLVLSLIVNAFLVVKYVIDDSDKEAVVEQEKVYEPAFITERKTIFAALDSVCDMKNQTATIDMKNCLGQRIDGVHKEIIQEEGRYIDAQKQQDREGTDQEKQEYIKLLQGSLEQSNKDLDVYADSYCAFEGYKYYGGTLEGLTFLNCKESVLVNHLAYIKVQNSI